MSFKDLRKNKGLSVMYVAQLLNIKVGTYRNYECHVRLPNASILAQMRKVYNCSGDDVIDAYEQSKGIYCERYKKQIY